MKKTCAVLSLCLVAMSACRKKEEPTPPASVETKTAPTSSAPAATTPPTATLPAGAPIPATGVALWLVADDAKGDSGGKLASWSNTAVPGVTATAGKPELQPAVVPGALNGRAVIRFDGEQNMLMTNVDISPAHMPDATVFAVFSSKTDAASPLRKLYGDDDGGYNRAVGLDDRGGSKNYTVFSGQGAEGYFTLKANETYITADQFTKSDFWGWVNGKPAVQKVTAAWESALPNLYIGGTGTVYHEPWQGDLAEMIVYARVLSDQERMQVEDYLRKKYAVPIAR
ncbi:MAG TPA: hypothetical protein VII12_20980 [Thermoanaerobaculia bacterium]